jgi:uncharacterized membrane protein YbhN (UPF0104 family)
LQSFRLILRYAIAALCLAYIVHFFGTHRDDLQLVLGLTFWHVVALAALVLAGLIAQIYQFFLVLRKCADAHVPFAAWLKTSVLGSFLNILMPQAGNVYRAVWLKGAYRLSYTRYVSGYFSFTWLDTCLGLLISAVVIAFTRPELTLGGFPGLWLVVGCLAGCAAAPLALEFLWGVLRFRRRRLAWVHEKIAEMLRVSVSNARDKVFLLKFSLVGLGSFVIMVAALYVAFRALGASVDWATLTLFYVVAKLGNQIIITPGNLGIQELAYGLLAAGTGVGMAEGVLVSVVTRLTATTLVFALAAPLGGFQLLHRRGEYAQTAQ